MYSELLKYATIYISALIFNNVGTQNHSRVCKSLTQALKKITVPTEKKNKNYRNYRVKTTVKLLILLNKF